MVHNPLPEDMVERFYQSVFQIKLFCAHPGCGPGYYDATNTMWPLAWHMCQVFIRSNPHDMDQRSSYLSLRVRLEELAVLCDALDLTASNDGG